MVQFIEFNGEQLPVRIKYHVLKMFQKETGKSFEDIMETRDISLYEPMLFFALESGARALKQDLKVPVKVRQEGSSELVTEHIILTRDNTEVIEEILEECMMEFIEIVKASFPTKEIPAQGDAVKNSAGNPETTGLPNG